MANGTQLCKVLFGILFGVMAVICVACSYYIDELTKETVDLTGTYICSRKAMRLCTGNLNECENALIYGYNLEGTGADESDDVFIVQYLNFQTACDDLGSTDACSQIEAGMVFQYSSIVSAVLGGLGLLLLIIPCTRKATCGLFISAGVSAAAAFAGFLILLSDIFALYM